MTPTLYPVANSVGPTQVRETDDAYVIEDVPFIRPMELAGGYVPEQSVRDTAAAWDGVPATLNHPRDEAGTPVAANQQPDTHLGTTENPRYDGTHVRGNIRLEKERLQSVGGEAGDIEAALRTGDPIDVSSQYASVDLPPGEYDGQHRANVEQIVRPDSVAILPNRTGVCSIEDGCGINPQLAANAAVTVPMTHDTPTPDVDGEGAVTTANADAEFEAGDLVRWSTSQGSPGTGRVATVVTDPGTTVSAEGADVTREATADEAAYKLDNWTGDEYETGVVVKSASELVGPWDDAPEAAMRANMAVPEKYRFGNPGEAVEAAQEMGFDGAADDIIHTHEADGETVFMPAPSHEALLDALDEMGEMDAAGNYSEKEMSDNAVVGALSTLRRALLGGSIQADDGAAPEDLGREDAVDRDALVDDIVSNSPLTEAALDARCDEGLEAIHADVMANTETQTETETETDADSTDADSTDTETDSDTDTTTPDMSDTDDPIGLDDLSDEAVTELEDRVAERIQANREDEQKAELATEIIANSTNYDSDDRETLLETPLGVLKDLHTSATDTSTGLPASGVSANASVGAADGETVDDYDFGGLN